MSDKKNISEFMSVMLAAMVVACSRFSDSFLYVALPLEYETLGLKLSDVGILLSINRVIRFFSNAIASHAYRRYGIKLPLLIATCISASVAFSYGIVWGFLLFLIARMLWGYSMVLLKVARISVYIENFSC